MMEDIIPTLILVAGLYFLIRWFFRPKSGSASNQNGDTIRGVTRSMVDTVTSAFPDIPAPNIIYSLSRTRSAQATSEELLERGFLPAPPISFRIPPSLIPASMNVPIPILSTKTTPKPIVHQSLIERYGLDTRLPSLKGKEKETDQDEVDEKDDHPGSTSKWEDTKEKREMDLKERKERMILEARKRMMEKQNKLEIGKA